MPLVLRYVEVPLHVAHPHVEFFVYYDSWSPLTCDKAVLFLFCLGDEGDKNASSWVRPPVELEFGNVGF